MKKLEAQHKRVMSLIARDRNKDGWASVSEALYSTLFENMPKELFLFEKLEVGGRVRLTDEGQKVLEATAWL